jgi:hypothetical protein
MSKPARTEPLDVLLALQAQVNQLTDEMRAQRAPKAKARARRGRQIAYSPGDLPGPKPSELDIARAQRLWRRVR